MEKIKVTINNRNGYNKNGNGKNKENGKWTTMKMETWNFHFHCSREMEWIEWKFHWIAWNFLPFHWHCSTPVENGNSTHSIQWNFHSIGVATMLMEFPRQWNFHSIICDQNILSSNGIHASGNARISSKNRETKTNAAFPFIFLC